MIWYALTMPKNRRTIINIENGANGKIGAPPQNRYTITSIENRVDGKTSVPPQVETTNIWSQKIGALSQIEIATISDFQILRIISLECALPDDLKIYVH